MITGIGHPAFHVRNLEAVLDFYCNQLGFEEMFRLYHPDGQLWIIYLRINDATYLELFPEGVEATPQPPKAVGFSHLCLTVDEMDQKVAELERRGVVLDRPIKVGMDGNRQAWIKDPEGNRIELMEMSPNSQQARAIERLGIAT